MNSPDAVDIRLFQRCVPLNALRAESQADLARKATLLHRRAGETLFHIGDDAAQSLYLIEGELQFEDIAGKALSTLRATDAAATHRIAHTSPSTVSARCKTDCQVVADDAGLIERKRDVEVNSAYGRGDTGGRRIIK